MWLSDVGSNINVGRTDKGGSVVRFKAGVQSVWQYCHRTNTNRRNNVGVDINAYCVKCREVVVSDRWIVKIQDSGRRLAQGKCPVCDTKVIRILGRS